MFRLIDKESHLLSEHLRSRFEREVAARVRNLATSKLDEPSRELIAEIVDSIRITGPSIVGIERGADTAGDFRPGKLPGHKVPTTRHYIAFQIDGDLEALEHWPDETGPDLPAIDEDANEIPSPTSDNVYDQETAIRLHEAHLDYKRWFIGQRPDQMWALCTFIDLTREEGQQVADKKLDLRAIVDARRATVEPIINAVRLQIDSFFADELPSTINDSLERRREDERIRSAVDDSLTFPNGWQQPPIQLLESPSIDQASRSESLNDQKATISASAEVAIARRFRLAPASLADVLSTTRVWVNAVERHPEAFRALSEDRLSDLLCATLNAALPGANREVYTRAGRADITVRLNALMEGLGPQAVFICEAKIWKSSSEASAAVDQLLGYLEVKDTAAMLIFYIKTSRTAQSRQSIVTALRSHAKFANDDASMVTGWPHLLFKVDDRVVRLCVAFVDLPPLPAR